jgi:hypothetical protein
MASANDEILDLMTTRALDLQRLAAGQSRDVVRFLNDLEGDIVAQLARIDPTGIGSMSRRAARLTKLLEQVKATITGSFRTEGKRLANELREIADMEAKFAAAAINQGAGVKLITKELTRGQLVAITGDLLVQGSPVSELLSRQAGDVLQRFTDNMRLGIAQGETNGELIRRIRGGKQNGEIVEGFMKVSRAHAETLVRSATQAVSQASRQAVYNDNSDIIKAEQWVSTIDLRTTALCSVRDGLTYTVGNHEPIGHSLPWGGGPGNLHYGCRSTSTPVLKTFRELGLDIDEVPASTRASLDGQIPQDTSFESWLSRRTVAEQNANLGVGRAALWRDGKISFRDLMDANGRELSLTELRARASNPTATVAPRRAMTFTTIKPPRGKAAANEMMVSSGIAKRSDLKGTPEAIRMIPMAALEMTERFNIPAVDFAGNATKVFKNTKLPPGLQGAIITATRKDGTKYTAFHMPEDFGKKSELLFELAKNTNAKHVAARRIAISKLPSISDDLAVRLNKMPDAQYNHSIAVGFDGLEQSRAVVIHEYGHLFHDNVAKKQIDDFLTDVRPTETGWGHLVSSYGNTLPIEYVAESFTIFNVLPASQHYRIHPRLLEIFIKEDRSK